MEVRGISQRDVGARVRPLVHPGGPAFVQSKTCVILLFEGVHRDFANFAIEAIPKIVRRDSEMKSFLWSLPDFVDTAESERDKGFFRRTIEIAASRDSAEDQRGVYRRAYERPYVIQSRREWNDTRSRNAAVVR